jgi:hypothetical protein
MNKTKCILLAALLCFLSLTVIHSPFAADEDFQSFVKQENEKFSSFIDEQEKDYAAYQEAVTAKWGEFVGSTKKVWVDYGSEKESRTQVDFQSGKISRYLQSSYPKRLRRRKGSYPLKSRWCRITLKFVLTDINLSSLNIANSGT